MLYLESSAGMVLGNMQFLVCGVFCIFQGRAVLGSVLGQATTSGAALLCCLAFSLLAASASGSQERELHSLSSITPSLQCSESQAWEMGQRSKTLCKLLCAALECFSFLDCMPTVCQSLTFLR